MTQNWHTYPVRGKAGAAGRDWNPQPISPVASPDNPDLGGSD